MDTQPHILIVEDSPTQARQLETLLSSFRFKPAWLRMAWRR